MACNRPLEGWRSRHINPETGKRTVVFNLAQGFADQPVKVPCGKCYGCLNQKSQEWAIRLYHESLLHEHNCFITLTYDDQHLPADGRISKKEMQNWLKRIRKEVQPLRLRYFLCGEYGERTRRPHYHAILFGTDFRHDAVNLTEKSWTSKTLIKSWQRGFIQVDECTPESCAYVAGYVQKKVGDKDTFTLKSRNLGYKVLDEHVTDFQTGVVPINGAEFPVPRAYITRHEESFESLKRERQRFIEAGEPLDLRHKALSKELNQRKRVNEKQQSHKI